MHMLGIAGQHGGADGGAGIGAMRGPPVRCRWTCKGKEGKGIVLANCPSQSQIPRHTRLMLRREIVIAGRLPSEERTEQYCCTAGRQQRRRWLKWRGYYRGIATEADEQRYVYLCQLGVGGGMYR